MAFQPVQDGVQVLMNYRQYGQQMQNQFWVQVTDAIDDSLLKTIGNAFRDWADLNWTVNASGTAELNNILVTDMSIAGGKQVTVVPSIPITGEISGDGSPANVTATLSWRTGRSGRSYRGRTYFIGLAESQTQGNQITAGTRTALLEMHAALITVVDTLGYRLCVCSRRTNNAPRPIGILTPILSVVMDGDVDSQRRRLAGRGR